MRALLLCGVACAVVLGAAPVHASSSRISCPSHRHHHGVCEPAKGGTGVTGSGGTSSGGTSSGGTSSAPTTAGTAALEQLLGPAFAGKAFGAFTNQDAVLKGGVVTVSYAAGSSAPSAHGPSGGAQLAVPLATGPKTTATLSYEVRFPVGFQFVKGGKLPGLYGGDEPFSGGAHTSNGWSARLMWRTGGAGEVYAYFADTTGYGDSIQRGAFHWLADGEFHPVVETVTINSPGESNGVVTLDYDGRRVITATGLDITHRNVPVGGVFFSTFFGGHDASWAPTTAQHVDFTAFG